MALEAHALVELMGHGKIAGRISERQIAGAMMLQVDVPATRHAEAFTKVFGASAIYCITFCDEATANRLADSFAVPPINPYYMQPTSPLLEAKIKDDEDVYFDDEDVPPASDDPDEF